VVTVLDSPLLGRSASMPITPSAIEGADPGSLARSARPVASNGSFLVQLRLPRAGARASAYARRPPEYGTPGTTPAPGVHMHDTPPNGRRLYFDLNTAPSHDLHIASAPPPHQSAVVGPH
jgi:hypothetical protein